MQDDRIISLSEQQEELNQRSPEENDIQENPEEECDILSLAPVPYQANYKLVFTMGQSHVEILSQEKSIKVALGRGFLEFKKKLPKRTRINELTIMIQRR